MRPAPHRNVVRTGAGLALLLLTAGCRSGGAPAPAGPPPPQAGAAPAALSPPPPAGAPAPAEGEQALDAPRRPLTQAELVDQLEPYPNLYKRFGLALGGALLANFDTTVRVDSPFLIGAVLDLEDTLGVESNSQVFRLDAFYAFNDRHRIDLALFDLSRSGTVSLQEDIEVGEIVIPASDVTTDIGTGIAQVAYRYNFVRDYRTTLALTFGLHLMRLDLAMNSDLGPGFSESLRADVPLPLLGVAGEYALGPKWKLYAWVQFLQVNLGFVEGYVRDMRVGVEHDPFEHFGWGIGLNNFTIDANFDATDSLTVDMEYGYQGLLLYLRTYF